MKVNCPVTGDRPPLLILMRGWIDVSATVPDGACRGTDLDDRLGDEL